MCWYRGNGGFDWRNALIHGHRDIKKSRLLNELCDGFFPSIREDLYLDSSLSGVCLLSLYDATYSFAFFDIQWVIDEIRSCC